MAADALEAIRASGTSIIADTAEFSGYADIERFRPDEGTTNPSIILHAAKQPAFSHLLSCAKQRLAQLEGIGAERLDRAVEYLAVDFGTEIWKLTGRVSTELDVSLSFDLQGSIAAALRIIALYRANGVPKEGVRIKIAATWEGVQAAQILEREHGISVLITVVLGLAQAKLAAEAGVTAIAPYVGRIGDWHKAQGHVGSDMGVEVVHDMQRLFRARNYKTQIMAASFRSTEQCKALAGLDMMTVSPRLLNELSLESRPQTAMSQVDGSDTGKPQLATVDPNVSSESAFRWAFNADACAVEKSAQALRLFAHDTEQLKALLAQ